MSEIFRDTPQFTVAPPSLIGSRDNRTGEVYFPPRAVSADGRLRPCVDVSLSPRGKLYAFTSFAGTTYGQVDLPEGVRILTTLADGDHEIDADYEFELVDGDNPGWRFRRA